MVQVPLYLQMRSAVPVVIRGSLSINKPYLQCTIMYLEFITAIILLNFHASLLGKIQLFLQEFVKAHGLQDKGRTASGLVYHS